MSKRGWAIALAVHDGGKRRLVGIDNFTMAQSLALGLESRLLADLLMCLDGSAQVACQPLLNGGAPMRGLVEVLLCYLRELSEGATDRQELRFGVAYPGHKDFALPRHWRPTPRMTLWRTC
jgi:hypothetical protein